MLFFENEIIDFRYSPIIYLNKESSIEITTNIDLLSQTFFINWDDINKTEAETLFFANKLNINIFRGRIIEAMKILKNYDNKEYLKYLNSTRKIVLFHHPKFRNFAIREAHGTIFLNVNENSTLSFFLEEIIHQCSHNVFNAITYKISDFFSANPYSPISDYIDEEDYRSLYGAFHGIYTTGKIVDVLLKIVKSENNFPKELECENLGRLALNINRTKIGLDTIEPGLIFTAKGKKLSEHLIAELVKNIESNAYYFRYNMKTHPVVFDLNKFKLDNPTIH